VDTPLTYSESIVIARSPEDLYDMVSDVTRKVVAASPGEEFAFTFGGSWARWGYSFTPVPGGTQVTESWEVLPDGVKRFDDRFGAQAAAQLANRFEAARTGIPQTLRALKRSAESGS
jgi:hypothetical protein